jgi:hypothetical protein
MKICPVRKKDFNTSSVLAVSTELLGLPAVKRWIIKYNVYLMAFKLLRATRLVAL